MRWRWDVMLRCYVDHHLASARQAGPSSKKDHALCTAIWTFVGKMILPIYGRLEPRRIDGVCMHGCVFMYVCMCMFICECECVYRLSVFWFSVLFRMRCMIHSICELSTIREHIDERRRRHGKQWTIECELCVTHFKSVPINTDAIFFRCHDDQPSLSIPLVP